MEKYVIFVHGLGGKLDKTWGEFPKFIIDDETIAHRVIEYGYTSPHLLKQLYMPAPTILNIANGLLSDIKAKCDLENDEIILVGHSMGGLIIKRLLIRLAKLKEKHKIKKVCFFDVPHGGSGFANIGKYISFRNRHLKSLVNNSSDLDAIDEDWVDQKLSDKLNILSIIDANETVVSSVSSKSQFRHHPIETINDVNHSSIVKPKSESDTVVILLKTFIKNIPAVGKLNYSVTKSIKQWLKYDERKHELNYKEDEARKSAYSALSEAINSEMCFVRITGLSGLGKSRLLLEYKNRNSLVDEYFIIINGADSTNSVHEALISISESDSEGIVIVDNCPVELHNYATNAFERNHSSLKLITTYFYHQEEQKLPNTVRIKLDKLDTDSISKIIEDRLPDMAPASKLQLENFIEGFPLLAQMTIKELEQEGRLTTSFDESNLVEKLINGDGEISKDTRELLKVFSLFDYFKFQKDLREDVNRDAEFLKDIAAVDQITFENTITVFNQKELINCTGSLARVVPKPLALNLAMDWWRTSARDRQVDIISNLPETLTESFCNQIKYLDSSVNVQTFVEDFCAANRPFGQAELLLSKQGSRLFRALVEVNPVITTNQVYRVFSALTDNEIASIEGGVRRDLVWALEMLVFHESCFAKASWCLFKLAQFENESFSNNAQGQFSQLFRWQLSGTEADFSARLAVLNKALTINSDSADYVVIGAVEAALSTEGGTRTIGAEFQGTKPELKEWKPEIYEEIHVYWDNILNILLETMKRGHFIDKSKNAFGNSISGLINYNILEKLDDFVREVVKSTGKYWPSAAQSITHCLMYNSERLTPDQKSILESWLRLLSPDESNIEEKLILIVLNPSKEFVEGDDGEYVDLAAEDAAALAKTFKDSYADLYQFFELLMTFPEQKQSWLFGKKLLLEIDAPDNFINNILTFIRSQPDINLRFFLGTLSGLYDKNYVKWKSVIDVIAADNELIKYYPDVVATGKVELSILDNLIEFIRDGKIPTSSASILIYGQSSDHLSEEDISKFCDSLSIIDSTGSWVALEIMGMYIHGRKDIDYSKLSSTFSNLVLKVSFGVDEKFRQTSTYIWFRSVQRLMDSEGPTFSTDLCNFLIEEVKSKEIGYSDLWDFLSEAFYNAFRVYGSIIWPNVKDRIIDSYSKNYFKLLELVGCGRSHKKRDTCIFDLLEQDVVVSWCCNEAALIIVGRSISIFVKKNEERVVNPLLLRLLIEFKNNNQFLNEISSNFATRSWVGSLVPYLEADKDLLIPLISNENTYISGWASDFTDSINLEIDRQRRKDLEDKVRNF